MLKAAIATEIAVDVDDELGLHSGDVQVPMVIRGPGGVGRQLGAEHSQRLESYFQSIPGVQLVACSTAANAKALLKSAIRSDNPIIFFEHVLLYNVKGATQPCALNLGSKTWAMHPIP